MKGIKLLLVLFPISIFGQLHSNINYGIGVGIGKRTPVGSFGAFYNQRLNLFSIPTEFKIGVGLDENLVLSTGTCFRLFGKNRKVEILGCADYVHHFSGDLRFEVNDIGDIYSIESYNYFQSSLLFRMIPSHAFIPQIRAGYSFLISEPAINHKYGPNLSQGMAVKKISSGITFEFGILVFLKP